LLPELEAGPRGHVRMTIAVDVERLAEAEAELTFRDRAGEPPRHAPAGTGSGAGSGGSGGARHDREAEEEEGGGSRRAASPVRACRRRRVRHWQQPTQLVPDMLHCTPIWTAPRIPVWLVRGTFSPRDIVWAVPYSHV